MRSHFVLLRFIQVLACVLVIRTTATVLCTFQDYFPPNFHSDFLLGRREYFFGSYQCAFYTHIVSGPFSLLSGLILISNSFRRRFAHWHRQLGRVHVICVLFLLAPSGLWMARYAATGIVAGVGFATLAVATAYWATRGWWAATRRRFDLHRRCMQRCFALLCSAVVLRAMGGLSDVLGAESTYPYSAWLSWIMPLIFLESLLRFPPSSPLRRTSAWRGEHREEYRVE